jgi:hypothetical protein
MRFLGELAQARNDGIDIERASTTWSTSSFTSYHAVSAPLRGALIAINIKTLFVCVLSSTERALRVCRPSHLCMCRVGTPPAR